MRYLAAAERTGDWLLAMAQQSPQGWFWPVQPGVSAEVEPSLGWGTASPVMFFVEAFRTTGERRFADASLAATEWIMTTVRTDQDTCAAFHHDPGGTAPTWTSAG